MGDGKHWVEAEVANKRTMTTKDPARHGERLGFRLDGQTKELIARAADLECRKLTDYCVTKLAEAARRTIAEHELMILSDRDRRIFFEALINPPEPAERLQRAIAEHRTRIAR